MALLVPTAMMHANRSDLVQEFSDPSDDNERGMVKIHDENTPLNIPLSCLVQQRFAQIELCVMLEVLPFLLNYCLLRFLLMEQQ